MFAVACWFDCLDVRFARACLLNLLLVCGLAVLGCCDLVIVGGFWCLVFGVVVCCSGLRL